MKVFLFAMILLMDSFDIKEFIKKPAVIIVAVILVLVLLFSVFFGGSSQDPTAKSVKNLSNRHQALSSLIDAYSPNVKSASLKSNLSQVSIILAADKNDVDIYFSGLDKESRKVKSSVSAKPNKELTQRLDQSKIANNLDSDLKTVVKSELEGIENATDKLKKANLDKKKLVLLTDKLTLNTQTMLSRLEESR